MHLVIPWNAAPSKEGGWNYGFVGLISKAEGDLTIRGVEFSER